MKTENLKNTGISLISLTAGAVISRMVEQVIPENKLNAQGQVESKGLDPTIKRVVLIGAGLIGATIIDRSTLVRASVQDASLGLATTQLGYLIKESFSDKIKNEKFKKALGSPDTDLFNWEEEYNEAEAFLPEYSDYENEEYEEEYEEEEKSNFGS